MIIVRPSLQPPTAFRRSAIPENAQLCSWAVLNATCNQNTATWVVFRLSLTHNFSFVKLNVEFDLEQLISIIWYATHLLIKRRRVEETAPVERGQRSLSERLLKIEALNQLHVCLLEQNKRATDFFSLTEKRSTTGSFDSNFVGKLHDWLPTNGLKGLPDESPTPIEMIYIRRNGLEGLPRLESPPTVDNAEDSPRKRGEEKSGRHIVSPAQKKIQASIVPSFSVIVYISRCQLYTHQL